MLSAAAIPSLWLRRRIQRKTQLLVAPDRQILEESFRNLASSEDREIQATAATHSHYRQVDLRFLGELNNLLVRFSDPHCRRNFYGLAPVRRNQFFQLLRRCSYGLCRPGRTWDLLQYMQQRELGVVLRRQRDRILQTRSEFSEKSVQKRIRLK